jgi:alpha-2-macroglobulin-like protein
MKHTRYLFFGLLILSGALGFRKNEDPAYIAQLKQKLHDRKTKYPEEKIYVQFDKPFYKPGETVWFNAMVLNSNTHQPTNVSNVVYVELIDPKGNVADRKELLIEQGSAYGAFDFAPQSASGLYQVRAFTNWMKNFGEQNFFKKTIQVQRVITPRLMLKLDFIKKAYGAGDSVTATLTATSLQNQPAKDASVSMQASLDGKVALAATFTTDDFGISNIKFKLPDTLNSPDGLLNLIISYNGLEESISRSIPIVLNKIRLDFFPEGGYAIANVSGNIAFKALNEFEKGADVSGVILDENKNIVTRFESYHMGMGAFEFTPLPGKKYYAQINSPAGNSSLLPLPEVRVSGLTLNLKEVSNSSVSWNISSTDLQSGYLVAQAHGELVLTQAVQLKPGGNILRVATDKFPAGIAVFTLFTNDGIAQCERLVFLNPGKKLSIRVTSDKKHYLPREKVTLKIHTSDEYGKGIPAKLSLSVADNQLISFADDKQDNLLSAMLLSSEVKGEIQEPSFYFDPKEPKAAKAIDYLLMTQGWRRFTWNEILADTVQIVHAPERINTLSGKVVDKSNAGVQSEVTLIEAGNKRRIIQLKTTPEGYFTFKNIDPSVNILLLTRSSGNLEVDKKQNFSVSHQSRIILESDAEQIGETQVEQGAVKRKRDTETSFSMEEDQTTLNEVVVVTGGLTVHRRELGNQAITVRATDIEASSRLNIATALSGKVPGILISALSSNPSAQTRIVLRGTNSLGNGRSEPLYVVNGIVMGSSLNDNFSIGSFIDPEDIDEITILSSAQAVALYGGEASNGVISITTRTRFLYFTRNQQARYSSLTIKPRQFSATREFYAEPPAKDKKREDFRTTIHWAPSVITDSKGDATLSFFNNDAVSSFRITAEGFNASGLLGHEEQTYHTLLPLSLDVKLPEFLGFEDRLRLPVYVKNSTDQLMSAEVSVNIGDNFLLNGPATVNVDVNPNSIKTVWFELSPKAKAGDFPVSVSMKSNDNQDKINQVIRIKPVGFPMRLSFSAQKRDTTFNFTIHEAEKGTLEASLTAYPDVLSDLFAGAESILREPHGCFEQVSSSTFPNILALQFMKQSGQIKKDVETRALSLISSGYNQLTKYEIKGGGFEWYGKPPAHEGLTAYGLLEFTEMKKVFNGVDEEMLTRTRDWLLSRKDEKGGYTITQGKYGFSSASQEVNNAYITYALSETGTLNLEKEYTKSFTQAMSTKDMYQLALVANTAFNLNKMKDYDKLISIFKESISGDVIELKADHSITRSYGQSLYTETLALWTLAILKNKTADNFLAITCIKSLVKQRYYGGFGSTQATTLALQSLTHFATRVRDTRGDGVIEILVNAKSAERIDYSKTTQEKIVMNKFAANLTDKQQTLGVSFKETENAMPYSVDIAWYTKRPVSDTECSVRISTSLSSVSTRVNETVRLAVSIRNVTNTGIPTTMAVIGIPSGLSIQPWQLKELQEKQVFDFYEMMNGNLVLYYREMGPNEIRNINLDLKAELPGQFTGAASCAYLYYTHEFKDWVAGNSIAVMP